MCVRKKCEATQAVERNPKRLTFFHGILMLSESKE
ncbi:Uncharacterised protein [Vibrio cholerae]|nr:Uncharacterised protein [Vibrio cholerae]